MAIAIHSRRVMLWLARKSAMRGPTSSKTSCGRTAAIGIKCEEDVSDNDHSEISENDIADAMLGDGGEFFSLGETPHPGFDGGPHDGADDDERGFDDGSSALAHLAMIDVIEKLDPDTIAKCAREPQNDTGNGQRL